MPENFPWRRNLAEGKTAKGIPVYNVAHAVLRANYPDRPPFRVFEVHTKSSAEPGVTPIRDQWGGGRRATDREVG